MHQQTRLHLQHLQHTMERLALWQSVPPQEAAFLSEQPFALDTMNPTEWLQEDYLAELLIPIMEIEKLLQQQC